MDQNCNNNNDKQLKVEKLLIEECDVFSKSEIDIGQIGRMKLEINVTNPTPICKPYCKTPTQLYSEVKEDIEDLLTNERIKTSYFSYANPMV